MHAVQRDARRWADAEACRIPRVGDTALVRIRLLARTGARPLADERAQRILPNRAIARAMPCAASGGGVDVTPDTGSGSQWATISAVIVALSSSSSRQAELAGRTSISAVSIKAFAWSRACSRVREAKVDAAVM